MFLCIAVFGVLCANILVVGFYEGMISDLITEISKVKERLEALENISHPPVNWEELISDLNKRVCKLEVAVKGE